MTDELHFLHPFLHLGIAAVNIGGRTIHSFAGIQLARNFKEVSNAWSRKKEWRACKVLIIDEISMMHALLFHRLEIIARLIREDPRPFGGIQLVICGDFLQLPPVEGKLGTIHSYCFILSNLF